MKKQKKMLYIILITILLVFFIIIFLINISFNQKLISNNTIKGSNYTTLISSEVIKNIDKSKIINVKYELLTINTSLDYLYNNSNIVLIGTFNKNIGVWAPQVTINTLTNFNTIKVLKNNTNLNIQSDVTFYRMGGIIKLSDYEKNGILREDEFTDIPKEERENYYIVEQYGPDNKLNFESNDPTQYLIFLAYHDERLEAYAGYYGIREIKNNKVFDYDNNKYIDSWILEN